MIVGYLDIYYEFNTCEIVGFLDDIPLNLTFSNFLENLKNFIEFAISGVRISDLMLMGGGLFPSAHLEPH